MWTNNYTISYINNLSSLCSKQYWKHFLVAQLLASKKAWTVNMRATHRHMYIKKTQQRIYLEPVKGKPHDNEVDKKLYKSFVLYFVETYTQYIVTLPQKWNLGIYDSFSKSVKSDLCMVMVHFLPGKVLATIRPSKVQTESIFLFLK